MPKLVAEDLDLDRAREFFARHADLKHMRCGPQNVLFQHAGGPHSTNWTATKARASSVGAPS
jgi:hypothetical protein